MKRILVLLMIAAVVIISGCAIENTARGNIFAEAADSPMIPLPRPLPSLLTMPENIV